MTWTYSGDPAASQKDALRDMIGDTIMTDQELSDEEVLYELTQTPDTRQAAIRCCTKLMGRYARLITRSIGGISVQMSMKFDHYKALREDLRSVKASDDSSIPAGIGPSFASQTTDSVPFFVRRPFP